MGEQQDLSLQSLPLETDFTHCIGDLEENHVSHTLRSRGRRRGSNNRSHTRGGKGKRNKTETVAEKETDANKEDVPQIQQFDQDCDIASLEAPTFTTVDRGPPAPMLCLSWDHPVDLIGDKVISPRIHMCDKCEKPILIYGRMIPCKHVFCLTCAQKEERVCPRCGDRIARVEQTGLGTVYMCDINVNSSSCKRTYLSQRDLQAHIDHRHRKLSNASSKEEAKEDRFNARDPRGDIRPSTIDPRSDSRIDPRTEHNRPDPRVGKDVTNVREPYSGSRYSRQNSYSQQVSNSGGSHRIPVMTSTRTNLITVPIQDQNDYSASLQSHIATNHPPPLPHAFTSPPPPHVQPPPYPPTTSSSYSSLFSTQQPLQTYLTYPTGVPPPQSSGMPPPSYAGIPSVPPPTYASRQYENQYSTNHWSTPHTQSNVSHLHHSTGQSYYR